MRNKEISLVISIKVLANWSNFGVGKIEGCNGKGRNTTSHRLEVKERKALYFLLSVERFAVSNDNNGGVDRE